MWNAKDVYYVSDSTALLAEDLGRSMLCQFPSISFREEKVPFVRTKEDAKKAVDLILEQSGGRRPLIFSTIMDNDIRAILDSTEVEFFDMFDRVLGQLEGCLETESLREPGFYRRSNDSTIALRSNAIHFTLEHDDGTRCKEYSDADVILVGVSRSGKTPVSVYLATHMSLKTANFPLTEDHINSYELPQDIVKNRKKAVGLTTSAEFLHRIREERYRGSQYAKLSTCLQELQQAEQLFMRHNIKTIKTEGKSIEEISVQVTQLLEIARKRSV